MSRHISISSRLTFWFVAIFLFGWIVFGTSMFLNLRSTLKSERRLTLTRRLDRLEDLLAKSRGEDIAARDQDIADFAHATGNGLMEVFDADGHLVVPSPTPAATNFPWPSIFERNGEQFVRAMSGGQSYWVLRRPYSLQANTVFVTAAAPEAGNLLVLERFRSGLFASFPILLLLSAIGGYWLSRRALKPVDRITEMARSISIRNLSERLPPLATGDELERLTATCNAMLGRLESSVAQIRQFTADASHELRGPLSFTRTVSEVALRNPGVDSRSRQAFEDIIAEATNATVLLDEMLTLARADADKFSVTLEPIDLTAIVRDVYEFAKPIANRRNLSLALMAPPPEAVHVVGDAASVRRLLWVLVDNALKYTDAQGRVEIQLSIVESQPIVSVTDTGIGIAKADVPRIFERFFRADPSRARVEGNGLGLAIAKWIADVHCAILSVESEVSDGTTFQVKFPRAASLNYSTPIDPKRWSFR